MSSKKIIAVTGATGTQGGSVARFLAQDGTFAVRAITRNPNSSKAKALQSKFPEIQIVQASLEDSASLQKALQGVYGVFGLTDFWEHGGEGETRQGKALVDAAKAAGVHHFIYSTLDNGDPEVPHWVSKWEVDEYLKESGVPRTSLYTGFYVENFLNPMMAPKKVGDDTYLLAIGILPDAPIFTFPSRDTGAWVLAALKDPETWIGKDMRIVTEWLTTREMAATASRITGKNVICLEIDQDGFEATKNAPWPSAEEIYLNMLFFVKHGPESGIRDQKMTLKLYPNATTWEQHVKENQAVLFP